MKNLVVYSSVTGNTKKIAEAIKEGLPDCQIASVEEGVHADNFENVFVGFWCDKGVMDEKATNYLKGMKPRKVAIFGTLGGDPKSEGAHKFAKKVKDAIPSHLEVIDLHLWQGKVDPKVIEMMSKMPNMPPMTAEHKARIEEAAKHPDEKDCKTACEWARQIADKENAKQ